MGKYSVVGQSGALKRERTSRFREMLMTEALTKMQSMSPEKFQLTVSSASHAFNDHSGTIFFVK